MSTSKPPPIFDIMYWKLAIWKLAFGIFKVAVTGFLGATTAVKWSSMGGDEKLMAFLMIALAVGTFVDGFLDQTLSRLIAGKPLVQLPEANGNGHATHTEITTTTIETSSKGSSKSSASEEQK